MKGVKFLAVAALATAPASPAGAPRKPRHRMWQGRWAAQWRGPWCNRLRAAWDWFCDGIDGEKGRWRSLRGDRHAAAFDGPLVNDRAVASSSLDKW